MLGYVSQLGPRKVEVVLQDNAAAPGDVNLLLDQNIYQTVRPTFIGETDSVKWYSAVFRVDIPNPCLLTVSDASTGETLPPGQFVYSPNMADLSRPHDLFLCDELVRSAIGRMSSIKQLQAHVALLLKWGGLAVDRYFALSERTAAEARDIRALVEKTGSIGGALQHFTGLIQSKYQPIVLPLHTTPEVSVVIPVHNKFSLTYDCIKSISNHLPQRSIEVVLVDDLSSDETMLSNLVFFGAVRVVRNSENLGFVRSCNRGAEAARGEYLFFLNNDTIVEGAWLDSLVSVFEIRQDAGIVGSRLLYESRDLQDCGGLIWQDGSGWNWGRDASPQSSEYRFLRRADYVSGAALMIRSDVFKSLGSFSDEFAPAYYEDTDLCFKARRAGLHVYVQPASTIVHLEGQSNGRDLMSGLKAYQLRNQGKFAAKWRSVLAKHQLNGEDVRSAIYRYYTKTLLFVDDTVLTPDRDAGSNAALQHILSFIRLGFHPVFLPADNMADIPPYTQQLEALGVECIYYPAFRSFEDFIRNSGRTFDAIYLHRFSNARKYLAMCGRYQPEAVVLYNVADLHSLRDARGISLGFGSSANAVNAREELDLVESADVTIVHSSFEADYIRQHRPGAEVATIPWAVKAEADINPYESRADIGFIGGFAHVPNIDAVAWFIEHVLPLLEDAGIRFVVAGSSIPPELQAISRPNLHIAGYVEDLNGFLSKLRLTVAPLRFGAGLKGKVMSSFAQGTPCVMTEVAAEGFRLDETLMLNVSDEPARMAERIIALCTDRDQWVEACWAGVDLIDRDFSHEVVDELVGLALSTARHRRDHRFRDALMHEG